MIGDIVTDIIFPRRVRIENELDCMSFEAIGKAGKKGKIVEWCNTKARGLNHGGAPWSGYRLSYHLNISEITRQLINRKEGLVCHTCDNQWCVNPKHLYLGTASDNIKDIFERNVGVRERISEGKKGIKASDSAKKKMSASQTGRMHSQETINKMRESALKRWNPKMKEECNS